MGIFDSARKNLSKAATLTDVIGDSVYEAGRELGSRAFNDNAYNMQNRLSPQGYGNQGQTAKSSPEKEKTPRALAAVDLPYAGGSVGGGGATGYNPADLAYLDNQAGLLRQMLGRTGNTLNQGLANLTDSYNREVGGANQRRSRALEDFGVQREDMTRGKQDAIGQVDMNARTLNDSLRRTLGMASGSDSSAYKFAAPNAVAREASGERGEVLGDFAENERSIATAEKRAEEDFASLLDDLARQRNQSESGLRSGVLESRQNINRSLADIAAERSSMMGGNYNSAMAAQKPYAQAINARQQEIDSLFNRFRSPQLTAKPVEVQTPELQQYMVDEAGIAPGQAAQPQYSPYSNFLRRDLEEELL